MIGGKFGTVLDLLACLAYSGALPMALFYWIMFIALFFTRFWYISALYLIWWIYDRHTPCRGGIRRLDSLRQLSLWKYTGRYFPVKFYKTADLDPSKNYLFAIHPHGLPVFSAFVNFATNATGFDEMFPGITMHVLSHNMQYYVPFLRELLISAGARSVNAESATYNLTKLGPGNSVLIAVGGVAEMFLNDPKSYTLKLKTRKGFIKMALKTGASVVPVYAFNEHRIFEVPTPEKGSVAYYFSEFLGLFMHYKPPLVTRGRWWWLPMLPKQLPLNTVVGAPIDFVKLKSIKKGETISEELVDECHQIYKDEVTKLYNEHRARFGDADVPLIFV